MRTITRRALLGNVGALPLFGAGAAAARAASGPVPENTLKLQSITRDASPIAPVERRGRVAKLQSLMQEGKIGALLVESGSTLEYFTGVRWHRSERTTAAIIPARGEVLIVTPAFEEPSVRETLEVGNDVRAWNEHESP